MRTLLTGFGPFLGITDNPTARLARHFAAHGAPGHTLTVRVLPVSFAWTSAILDHALRSGAYDAAILLGVDSGGKDRIRLERYGRNRTRGASPDVDGHAPGEHPLRPGAPDLYETRLETDALRARLEGLYIPVYVSEDAGGYVCNAAYYTALHAIHDAGLPTRCVFIHVPPHGPLCPLSVQRAAVVETLAFVAG